MQKNKFKSVDVNYAFTRLKSVLNHYELKARERVINNEEHLYSVLGAVILLRAESLELVVVGFDGRNKLINVAHEISKKAISRGFKTIRIHTKRKGECRFLNKHSLPFILIEKRSCGEFVLLMELNKYGR